MEYTYIYFIYSLNSNTFNISFLNDQTTECQQIYARGKNINTWINGAKIWMDTIVFSIKTCD